MIQSLVQKNEELEMKLLSRDSDLEAVLLQKEDLLAKLTGLEDKLTGHR
jgi:hypothetical protein